MNELQLFALSEKALNDNGVKGYLFKRTTDSGKWQCRYFVQFQNLLFYYESDSTTKPSGVIFLEGSYLEKVTSQQSSRTASQVSHSAKYLSRSLLSPLAHFLPFARKMHPRTNNSSRHAIIIKQPHCVNSRRA